MVDDVKNTVPQMTDAVTVSNATFYGVISSGVHHYKSGPGILSIKKVSGAGTPSFSIVDASDGANLRALQSPVDGTTSSLVVDENEAIQLPFIPKTIGIFSGSPGTWVVEFRLHY